MQEPIISVSGLRGIVGTSLTPDIVSRYVAAYAVGLEAGSVVVDVSVDQGGCIETIRPSTHSDPVYMEEGVVHYGVTNMPGAVPRTSTYALSNATLPYFMELAEHDILPAIQKNKALLKGVNTHSGKVTYDAVAETFELEYTPLESIIS